MRDYIWFINFKTFWFFAHPHLRLLKVVRRIFRRYKKTAFRPIPNEQGTSSAIPRRIWIYWAQGWEDAPELITACKDSWYKHNPGWEIILLDEQNIEKYVDLNIHLGNREIPFVWKADLLRLHLLEKYGGVWADATTFCTAPLDTWLPYVMQSGFFAFDKPKTTLASWFLVAEKRHTLVCKWREAGDIYWRYTSEGKRYWIFFTFEFLIFLNKKLKSIWYNTVYFDVEGAYRVQNLLKQEVIDVQECIRNLSPEVSPVHKLNWKIPIPPSFLKVLSDYSL